ncbi:anti-sigma factor domain-containing protein [Cellulosimicrobium sp. NPDC055967]|uniref:anti-sigma factor domain-containing protein n=1 Tax=Cellulosimicrobium sp. NPDC055967 TaxID=3345670 RepID=UPI0035DD396B
MQHIDDETLALLALGEDVLDDDARAHLASCAECADAAARLARVADAFDGADAPDELVEPPPAVWSAIRAELDLPTASTDLDEPAAVTPSRADAPDGERAGAVVVPLAPRRRRVWVPVAAASAALLVGVAGGVLWERREAEPPETTVASATLDPLPDWEDASGDARVEEQPDGRRQVVVTVDAPVPEGTYREVWLLAEDLSGLVSLGVLDGAEGRFDLPDGLDLTQFPVVDVSEEHFDGDPAHSGDSVVRGPLDV